MFYLIFFLIQLFSLYFVSKLLMQALSNLFYKLTKSMHATIWLLASIFMPGTLVHELSHALTAGVLLVHVGDVELMPEVREDSVKLGTVEIGKTDPIRRSIIGVAPVILGITLIILSLWYFTTRYGSLNYPWWAILILGYLIFVISNTMFSSRKDMEGVIGTFIFIILVFFTLYYFNLINPQTLLQKLLSPTVVEVIKNANIFIMVPIILDLLIFLFVRLVFKIR